MTEHKEVADPCVEETASVEVELTEQEGLGLRQRHVLGDEAGDVETPDSTKTPGSARDRMRTILEDEEQEQKQCRNDLLLVYLVVALDFLGLTILMPSIRFLVRPDDPGAFEDIRDGTTDLHPGQAVSYLMLAFGAGQFIATPTMGFLSDRVGRRPLLIASTLGGAIGYLLQGTLWSFWWNVAARFLTGLFGGSRPVVQAYIADAVPAAEMPIYIGYIGLCVTFAMQFGPVLGGSLSLVSYKLPMFVASVMSFVLFVLVASCLHETHEAPAQDDAAQEEDEVEEVSEASVTTFRWILIASGFVILAVCPYQFTIPLLMADKFGLNPNEIGLLQWGDGLTIVVGTRLFNYLVDKWSLAQIAMLGTAFSLCQIGIPLMPTLLTASAIRYPGMLIGPTVQPALSSIIVRIAPRSQRGTWLATSATVQSFMRAVAPLGVGVAYDHEHWLAFAVTASCAVPLLAVLCVLDGRLGDAEPMADPIARLDEDEVYEELCQHYDRITALLAHPDGIDEHLPVQPHTPEQEQAVGRWLAGQLDGRGYKRWHEPQILPAVKALIMNALPVVEAPTRLERIENVLKVYETHIRLNREIKAAHAENPLLHTGM